jgi:hypothetical protein
VNPPGNSVDTPVLADLTQTLRKSDQGGRDIALGEGDVPG